MAEASKVSKVSLSVRRNIVDCCYNRVVTVMFVYVCICSISFSIVLFLLLLLQSIDRFGLI